MQSLIFYKMLGPRATSSRRIPRFSQIRRQDSVWCLILNEPPIISPILALNVLPGGDLLHGISVYTILTATQQQRVVGGRGSQAHVGNNTPAEKNAAGCYLSISYLGQMVAIEQC